VELFTNLFKPIRINRLELANRIIFPPITTAYDVHYDLKGDEHSAYFYEAIASGGAALLVIGALQAIYPGRREPPRVEINRDQDIAHLRLWTNTVHKAGSKAAAQLAVWNYWSKGGEGTPPEDISPSGIVTQTGNFPHDPKRFMFDPHTRPLETEEIGMIVAEVARSAIRALEAGFDAVEIPVVAQNLLERFIIPFTNRRDDRYGGSLENRVRFAMETIAKVRTVVGQSYPILCRIAADDMVPWGMGLTDWQKVIPYLEEAGVDAITMMPGGYETRAPRQQMVVPRDAYVHLAAGIKQVARVPVCANMRINDPRLAERIIRENKADLVAMGRPLLADPQLPIKTREGRVEDVRFCVACCSCFEDIAEMRPVGCSVNPIVGWEHAFPLIPALKPKLVCVVGGGPGGMEAARVATLRGHRVTLWEKGDRLGGELLDAVLPPHKQEWQSFIDYETIQLGKLRVDIRLNQAADVGTVLSGKPDAVIVATGAIPVVPPIPGAASSHVMTAEEALRGRPTKSTVTIIGGGLIGCETAEHLVRADKKVTILEKLQRIGDDIGSFNRWVLLDRLEASGVRMETGVKVTMISGTGVEGERKGRTEWFPAETVVLAVGYQAEDALARQLEGKVANLYKIGACVNPRRVRQAVEEGFRTAYGI
jgi:2,4-dienoyl-CoA reductase (NADPH2)